MCYAKEVSVLWSYALPGPYGTGTCPPPPREPSPLCLTTGNSVCLQPRKMNLDSIVDIHEQPNPESADTGQCMCILFYISHLVILSFGTSPKWFIRIVLILVIFLGLINHGIMNFQVRPSHFPGCVTNKKPILCVCVLSCIHFRNCHFKTYLD